MTREEGQLVTRTNLFNQVWDMPISQLAKKYGISDVGLAKICRRMEIPRPPRGYWRKLEVGKAPLRPTILPAAKSCPDHIMIIPTPEEFRTKTLGDPPEFVPVPEILADPHPLTRKSLAALNRGRRDDRGLITPRERICLDVSVTRPSIDRACRIMDALLKALEAHGYPLSVTQDEKPKTEVIVDGEGLEFGIDEKIRCTVHVHTSADDARIPRTFEFPPRYDYSSTGRLSLRLRNAYSCGRQQWSDGKHQKVENLLGSFIQGFKVAAQLKKAQREERERWQKQWEEEAERRRERERMAYIEGKRAEKLTADVNAWVQAARIRRYTAELKHINVRVPRLSEWIAWALKYADSIDPLHAHEKIVFVQDPEIIL